MVGNTSNRRFNHDGLVLGEGPDKQQPGFPGLGLRSGLPTAWNMLCVSILINAFKTNTIPLCT